MEILKLLYPKDEIFVKEYTFKKEGCAIKSQCLVPLTANYSSSLVPYVTAENHLRCLSQNSYLLAQHLIRNKLLNPSLTEDAFISSMLKFELQYRHLAMTFHQKVDKGKLFEIVLELKNFREIKGLNDSLLFVFSNKRTVISGEMSFICSKK